MMNLVDAFSTSYAQARVKFLEAAAGASLSITSHNHPLAGLNGELLAMDVALDGAPDADKLLIVSSGCHGVEGFGGSGVQVFALHDAQWREKARAQGVAVLYVHALNPYGFSHGRRVTHENVDLNRNFLDFDHPLPHNNAYRALHPLLLPDVWPPGADNMTALGQFVETQGRAAIQAVVTRGQYEFADGLFFGGVRPTWSNLTLRHVLRTQAAKARRVAWIDLHTGLGPSGMGERIFASKNDPAALVRARQWWDGQGATPVTSTYDGSATAAFLTGAISGALYEECPQAEYTGLALEFGTQPPAEVLQALRAEQWLATHPQAPATLASGIRQQMRDAFYTDTDGWKGLVISQSRQAMFQAVDGLSA